MKDAMAGTLGALVLAVGCLGRSRVEDFVCEWASWCNHLFLFFFFFFLARGRTWARRRTSPVRPTPRGTCGWVKVVGMLGGDS
jgi:hypothetical protein